MILEQIVAHKQIELVESKGKVPLDELKGKMVQLPPTLDFASAIAGDSVRLIAEVKKASPSRGIICPDFDPVSTAQTYARNSVAAISVLTESRYFQGSLDHLQNINIALGVKRPPLLRKDFIFDPYQVYESRAYGADSLLLIVAILTAPQLQELLHLSRLLGMECLVEVHNEAELKTALECNARIIGINNRDLHSFKTDISVTRRLRPLIPTGKLVVSESGISTTKDMQVMRKLAVNAVLVGEALMSTHNISEKIRELL